METPQTSGVEIDYEIKDNKVFFKGILRRFDSSHHSAWKFVQETIDNYNELVFQFQNKIYCEMTFGDYWSSYYQENFKNAFSIRDVYTRMEGETFLILGELISTTEAGGMKLLEDAKRGVKFFSRITWEHNKEPEVTLQVDIKKILKIDIISTCTPKGGN